MVPHFRTPPYYSLDPPTSAATRIPTQDTTSGTFHTDQPQSPWKKQISILKTKVPACDCIYTRLLNIWSSNPHGIGSKNVKYTRIAMIFHGESGDELSMFINVQTNPHVWLGIMIFGGWIMFTCWCPICPSCWCPSCPLVGYCPLFGFNLQSLGVSSAKKKRNCYYSHGISRTHMPDLLRNHQKHGWNPSLCCDWGACWAHCLVMQNPFDWDQWFSLVITHGSYPCCPYLVMVNNGE